MREVVAGVATAVIVEDYPDFPKGPWSWSLNRIRPAGRFVVWGIAKGQTSPAVLITAYRPDPAKWDETWLKRRT